VLNLVLLAGQVLFLLVLYLFIYSVMRSAVGEMRSLTPAARGRLGEGLPPGAASARRPVAAGPQAASGWALEVVRSRYLPVGRRYELDLGVPLVVGRAGDVDLHLDDTFVSSRHARLFGQPDGLRLEDLGSTNGTQVDGRELSGAVLLAPGAEVAIGDTVFLVEPL